jgi:hypothetical protein
LVARKAIRALLVAFAAILLTAGAVMPATAQESPGVVFENPDEMSAQARHFNEVATVQALYQCPATFCNKGEARPGQALGEICTLDSGGIKWALVYNRANGHTGFINTLRLIHEDPKVDCGRDGLVGPISIDVTLYQCPAFFCNKGEAKRGHMLRGECYVETGDGWYWIWVYNRNNHHEGFYVDTSDSGLERC